MQEHLKIVEAVARKAGQFIMNEQTRFKNDRVEKKGHNDFVSYVDRGAEEIIVSGLKDLIPEAAFHTEEATTERTSAEYTWVIDPLDGTTNFIHGVPFFAVSIALLQNNEPIIGVVYEINQDEMFTATKGGGTHLNGDRIQVSDCKKVSESLIGTGFPYYDYHLIDKYLDLFKHLMQHSRGLRRPGSAATDLAYTAAGRFDSFYEYSLSPWDVAAGILLVREAGGTVTNFDGGDDAIFIKEIVATNGKLHSEMLNLVQKYMK
jgi:myo-inositol-1(or 4)-monophosphatase